MKGNTKRSFLCFCEEVLRCLIGDATMKILITGGAGFIGSAVIRYLVEHARDEVANVDKLTYAGNLESLGTVEDSPRYTFYQADICDSAALDTIFTEFKPEAVMHLAAESHVDRSIDGPDDFIQTNIVGTFSLLEATRRYWSRLPLSEKQAFRFHHVSTDEVFGDLEGEDDLFTETTPYAPSSPYSASKASSDHLVRAWHRTYGLPVLVTNCSNNYGPYHFPEKLIPHIVLNALFGKPIPVYGDGSQVRDWLYVEDHACALVTVVKNGEVGETYNIGGHNEKSNLDVVETVCGLLDQLSPMSLKGDNEKNSDQGSETNKEKQASYKTLITFVADRPGHDRRYAIDASKIQSELGWVPYETFESGIRKTVEWYLGNSSWWQRVLDGSYQLDRLGESVGH